MARGAKSKSPAKVMRNDDGDISEDEVDRFHRTRLEALDAGDLQSDSENEQDSEEEFSEDDKEVFGDARPDSEESDDDDEEGDMEKERIERVGKQWGKSRNDFYKEGESDEEEVDSGEDEEMDEAEEAEAMRLQRKQAAKLSSADFDFGSEGDDDDQSDDEDAKNKSSKKGKKKKTKARSRKVENDAIARVAADAPELMALLAEFKDKTGELEKFAEPLLGRITKGDVATKEGVSYLESKIQLMLSYCINITFYLLMKAEGESVRDHPVIDQLLRCRTIMEKIRPLDSQLKNQVDMLIRQSGDSNKSKQTVSGSRSAGEKDPLNFRPNLDDLDSSGEEESEGESDDGHSTGGDSHDGKVVRGKGEGVGRYIVPKMAAAPFEEHERKVIKLAKEEEKRKRKLKKSKLYAEMREEFSSRPTEQSAIGAERDDEDLRKEDEERRKYEEENYTRLVETKKDRLRRKKRERMVQEGMMSSMGDLEDLRDLEALVNPRHRGDDSEDDEAPVATNKRSLHQFMSEMENKAKNKKKRRSGDEDLPIRDPEEIARRVSRRGGLDNPDDGLEDHFGGGEIRDVSDDDAMDLDADNELYQRARSDAASKKAARAAKYAAPERMAPLPQQFLGEDERRNASYKILKNKGLHAHKKKEERNPRVKLRKKFEKKMKRRKGQVQEIRKGESAMYGGEASGVRTSIVRSRKPGKI